MLSDGKDGWDIVRGVGVVGSEKRIVEVEFAHGHAIRPRGPFGGYALVLRQAEYRRAPLRRMAQRLGTGIGHRTARERCRGDAGIVDDAVADHLDDKALDRGGVGRHLGDLPGELRLPLEALGRRVGADVVQLHGSSDAYEARFPPTARSQYRQRPEFKKWLKMQTFAKAKRPPCEACE